MPRPKTPPFILKLRRITKAIEQISYEDLRYLHLHSIKQMNYQNLTTASKVGKHNRRLTHMIHLAKDHLTKKPIPTPDYRLTSVLKWEV